jgi:hypothetical protein
VLPEDRHLSVGCLLPEHRRAYHAEVSCRRALWYLPLALALSSLACGEAPSIRDTTRLGDTFDRDGPYSVRAVVAHPENADDVVLVVQLDVGSGATTTQRYAMGELRRGIFEAQIAGQPAFTRVRYHVEVSDGDTTTTDPEGAAQGQSFYAFWVLGDRCQLAADCLPGEFCDSARVCRARGGPCAKDVDCGKSFRCREGRCRLSARACSTDAGCLLGEVCDSLLGECAPRPRCPAGSDCPLDFVCEDELCKRQCVGDADCLPGERCDIKGICRVPRRCTGPADCSAGLVCDPLLGICRAQGAGPCGGCAADLDCGGAADHCLVIGGALRCGKDCSISGCPPTFSCDTTRALPQCVPISANCP